MSKPNLWCDSGRSVKFFIFDGKLALLFVIWLFDFTNLKILILLSCAIAFLQYLNYIGYNIPTFCRLIHAKIIKNKAYGKPRWFRRSYF